MAPPSSGKIDIIAQLVEEKIWQTTSIKVWSLDSVEISLQNGNQISKIQSDCIAFETKKGTLPIANIENKEVLNLVFSQWKYHMICILMFDRLINLSNKVGLHFWKII